MSASLLSLEKHLNALGAPLPEPLVGTLATWRAVREVRTADLTARLAADIAACKVTPEDATARVADAAIALTQREKAVEVAQNLERSFEQAAHAIGRYRGDEIIVSMRDNFDAAVELLTAAVQLVGPNPDARLIRQGGPELAMASARWNEAVTTLQRVERVRRILAGLSYGTDPTGAGTRAQWFVATANDDEDLERAYRAYAAAGDGFANLVAEGNRLRLNTAAETAELVAGASEVTRKRREAEAEAVRQANEAETERLMKPYREWAEGNPPPLDAGDRRQVKASKK
jgi:hypothetical protein